MRAAMIGRASWGVWPLRRLGMGLLLAALAGCAELPAQPVVSPDEVSWAADGAGLLPAAQEPVAEDEASLLRVTPPMIRFAQLVTSGKSGDADKTRALMNALGDMKGGLHMQYDAQATLTAEQAFEQRRANCLSHTMLFVALARAVGVPAQFNEVDIPPVWDMGDDHTSLLYRHVNARVELPLMFYLTVDLNGDDVDPSYNQYVISDADAAAQFYNNRAVELRLQKHLADSLRYETRALQLMPKAAYLWNNLANLYLLQGNASAARVAIIESLKLDGTSMLGYDTAAHVYEQIGESGRARYFHERAEFFLEENPYHHYQLAVSALGKRDSETAYEEAGRAIALYPKDSRFFFLMAVVLNQQGETQRAADNLRVALGLAPDAERQERYKSKFARLAALRG